MELLKEILTEALHKKRVSVARIDSALNLAEVLERDIFKALQEIKEVITDDEIDDITCYMKIERIIYQLGKRG